VRFARDGMAMHHSASSEESKKTSVRVDATTAELLDELLSSSTTNGL